MFVPFAAALVLSMACQSPSIDRSLAEQLARSGQTVEALDLFKRIVAQNPTDTEARLWIARLQLRLGRTEEAEAGFRSVLLEHPADVDARIGLGSALTRRGPWKEALTVLLEAESSAGENSDLFGALARAYRRAGDDRRALEYYRRAKALAPNDPDLVEGYEATLRAYGPSIALEGFGEGGASDARSVSLTGAARVLPRMLLEGTARWQSRNGTSDAMGGGGAIWKVNPSTNLAIRAAGGAGNTSLPTGDLSAEVRHYAGAVEIGANVRHLSFADVDVTAASPILVWDTGERWRFAGRYTYSWSSFSASGESSVDHSMLVRETFRGSRRIDLTATYAYGIESFEDLTADRIGNLGANTIAASLRVRLPSLLSAVATWDHQWRSNGTRIDRLTVTIVRSLQ